MRRAEVLIPFAIGLGLFALTYSLGLLNPVRELTSLARTYLTIIPDKTSTYTSMSFEVVTAVIWDQRGFDTFFETSVLFLAIIASLSLISKTELRNIFYYPSTPIVRLVSRVLAPVIIIVSLSVAIHGHVTPGGGFQGGSVFVVAPLIIMLAFSSQRLGVHGFRSERFLLLRALGVSIIGLAGLLPILYSNALSVNAYLFQNLGKPGSGFSYPALIDTPLFKMLLSGSLIIYNIAEYLAVLTGFTIALYYLTIEFEKGGVSG